MGFGARTMPWCTVWCACALIACAAEPRAATTGGGAERGQGGGDGDGCCDLEIPLEWDGPAMLWRGDGTPPSCPSPWVIEGPVGGVDVEAPSSCECACGEVSGGVCAEPGWVVMYDDTSCSDPVGAFTPTPNCNSSSGAPYAGSATAKPLPSQGGSCTPIASDVLPEPIWTDDLKLCIGAADTCGGEFCDLAAPDGFESLCVYRPGLFFCPPERYTERTILNQGWTDTRACTECTCDDPTDITCSTLVELWSEPDCSGSLAEIPDDQTCTQGLGWNVQGYRLLVEGPLGGWCGASRGELTGEVLADEPITVCCEP